MGCHPFSGYGSLCSATSRPELDSRGGDTRIRDRQAGWDRDLPPQYLCRTTDGRTGRGVVRATSFFRASREEMERAGESIDDAVEIADGGYIAVLGVYHELHCLRHLRFYLYREHYYPNLTAEQMDYLHIHLEALRKSIMCHGNSALFSFKWYGKDSPRATVKSGGSSVCVKWDAIQQWSSSRALPYGYPLRWNQGPDGLA
ncbi:hypothetical protein F5Y19DRAFT_473212 [Xylariaceae sp. FL1651]|nr:hypothetical protein F5Y19DRAFT_473212 [Xylariaceae sp. FL1651]